MRLSEDADWTAVLRAFAAAWQFCPDGGSAPIRDHLDEVAGQLAETLAGNPEVLPRRTEVRPAVRHLPATLAAGSRGAAAGLARTLAPVSARLTWEWGYATLPEALAEAYAYCEILGPRGPVRHEGGLILGFVLFAPGTFYPPHAHKGIAESYMTIAGHWSQNDGGVEGPGSLVFNPPGTRHFITTGRREPCLLAYAWTGESARLAAPGMVLD